MKEEHRPVLTTLLIPPVYCDCICRLDEKNISTIMQIKYFRREWWVFENRALMDMF
jgi:hypothetical protein